MRYNLRWQLLLAALALGLVLSLLSFQSQASGLCTTRVPAAGGTFVEGIVGAPLAINPLLSDNYPVDRELASLVFDGLTRYDETGELVPALAQSWQVSEDGLTVRFELRPDVTWHDGEPFTAGDVVFTYGLLQDEAFPGSDGLKRLWQAVDIKQIDTTSVEFTLPEPYAPFLEATTRGILPSHRLAGVSAAALPESPFNIAPVGTGPFMIESGQDWLSSGRLRLSLNPVYWRRGTRISTFEFRFFPDDDTLVQAFERGEIQAINHVSAAALPQVAAIPGVRLFSAAAPRATMLLFNESEDASPALDSANERKALASGLDREKLIDDVLNGQGVMLEGPYLPSSWAFHPELLTHYQFQPVSASVTLEAAGWLLPGADAVRQLDGSPLTLRILGLADPVQRALAEAIARMWREIGVDASLNLVEDGRALQAALAERAFDVALVEVTPPNDPDLYDFWSQEAIIRGQNYAGWNRRRASEALESGRKLWTIEERRPYYDAFLTYFDQDLPALTLYQDVTTYALSSAVYTADIGLVSSPRDRYRTIEDWFLLFRDVTISCPAEATT
jgi:peptide/nickel transport system substrate-binding protein